MSVGSVSSAVGTHEIPEYVGAISSLPDMDYADRFALSTDADATPEQWARAMFGNVPGIAQQFIWRGLLGLRLSRGRSPATVGGWRIGGWGADWIRLETASWFLSADLLVQTVDERVSLTTCLHYDRRLGRIVCPRCPPSIADWCPGCSATPNGGSEQPDEDATGVGAAPGTVR